MTPLLLTEEQAARRLNVGSAQWLATRRKRGLIPYTQLGRYVRYSDEQLAEIVRKHLIPANRGR